ncbi:hypothetical protein L208DRAFT_1385924 [Tricholoma matsutake]|nr:hypothetical protein L208DRAFT_1385924 [Tricholoma matsutake 945]
MRPALPFTTLRQSLVRPAFRQQRQRQFPRFASNSSSESTQKQAQETLGKVWESTKKFLEPTGRRIGLMLGSYKQPLVYNLSVTRELLKQIYRAENLQPPSIATIRSVYGTLWSRATSVPYWRETVRSMEIVRLGIYGVEAYTIFKVGEILGRRHLIGYDLH